MRMDSKFHVGDRVVVGRVDNCSYGWNGEMQDLCGCVVTIRCVEWDDSADQYKYGINKDWWTWDDSCFEFQVAELPDFDASGVDIFDLLN